MKIEDQVTSIEQTKTLQALGIHAKSILEHCEYVGYKSKIRFVSTIDTDDFKLTYPAYTLSEIAAMASAFDSANETASMHSDPENLGEMMTVDWMTKQLIHLLETGKITAADCNQRLTS